MGGDLEVPFAGEDLVAEDAFLLSWVAVEEGADDLPWFLSSWRRARCSRLLRRSTGLCLITPTAGAAWPDLARAMISAKVPFRGAATALVGGEVAVGDGDGLSVVGGVFDLRSLLLSERDISSAFRFCDAEVVAIVLLVDIGRGDGLFGFSEMGEGEGAVSPVMPAMTELMNCWSELLAIAASEGL